MFHMQCNRADATIPRSAVGVHDELFAPQARQCAAAAVFGVCVVVLAIGSQTLAAEPYQLHTFDRTRLTDLFFAEGATHADLNRDGQGDVVVGPHWYAGPDFHKQHELYPPQPFHIDVYSDNFLTFAYDVSDDGWTDVVVFGFPGREVRWYENPRGEPGHWLMHIAFEGVDNESPTLSDLTGDGRPELVFHTGGRLGYAEIPADDPRQPWIFHPISEDRGLVTYTHGLGVGDVNGDGRADLLERTGWWEQPADLTGDPLWTYHPVPFADPGGAQMLVYDVDGDGDNDVVTSMAAHAYGVSWFEHVGEQGAVRFREHKIMGQRPEDNEFGVEFSQHHALALADIDGDGVDDFVTGKRYWAHQDKDPGSLDPAVLYWFRTDRSGDRVRFVPHRIDSNSGVGTQVTVGDVNGDELPDIIVGNKKGGFVFLHRIEQVDQAAWHAAQPPAIYPPAEAGPLVGETPAGDDKETGDPASETTSAREAIDDFPASAANGRDINLDLELGDLSGWVAEGDAFAGQPVRGDTVQPRRNDMQSGHRGDYWIGTYEVNQDGPRGTLTSAPFRVTHPYASFLVGGGAHERTRVEVVDAATDEVLFAASGRDDEQMHRVAIDLQNSVDRDIFLRIVDQESGHWGHVNFDHFRFHDQAPEADVVNPRPVRADQYAFAGLTAEQAAQSMKLPNGFSASVYAAEPDVQQPIAMALDDRGRVWVAEAYEYPRRAEGEGRDRILIFTDADGDGRFDQRKVFAEGLNLVSGLEIGFGGVWVGAAPYLLFIPDRDGDDRPDGEPQIVLDGWGYEDTHETLNSFIWGPDGWLYGCHGVFTHSLVGKPGTPDAERVPLNAGIWRYHPVRQVFEVFAHGTSNPWGIDFNDHGQAICTACVIPHLFHVIQGARYQRQAGQHFNPHTYADVTTIADHLHYQGATPWAGNDKSGDVGGGHAHAGAMIYLGDAWPGEYRGQVFMNNIHGQRINVDVLKPQGSGYVGTHGPDFLLTQDRASQMLNFRYGPDGQAFVIDWYDMQACHLVESTAHDRSNGRIYRLTYDETNAAPVDLKQLDLKQLGDRQLAELSLAPNDWYVRHSRRILQERAAAGKLADGALEFLRDVASSHDQPARRLRAMWALHAADAFSDELIKDLLRHPNPHVRGWTVQLALDPPVVGAAALLPNLVQMASSDDSQVVRLYLASAAGRLPLADRWELLAQLTRHAQDATDHNLPLMYWYAAEPLAEADPQRALALGMSCAETVPKVQEYMLRRIGSLDSPAALAALVRVLGDAQDADAQLTVLEGIRASLQGRRQVAAPAEWADVFARILDASRDDVKLQAAALGVAFGDPEAMTIMRQVAMDEERPSPVRREALQALLDAGDPQLPGALKQLLGDSLMSELAIRGLAQFDDPGTPRALLDRYESLSHGEKQATLSTLCSRPAYAVALLKAIFNKRTPASDLSAPLVIQLLRLDDDQVRRMVQQVWGSVRTTPAEKAQLIADYKQLLTDSFDDEPDPRLGRAIFAKTCQQCHTLYGVGDDVGPDLTGSNRNDVDYLLTNIVDPGALIAKVYQTTIVVTSGGRVVTGVLSAEDEHSITLRNADQTLVIPKDEIESRELADASIMPEDQLKQFSDREITSLLAYLRSSSQSPMLATRENAGLMFNGRDLTYWNGDPELWSVEEGEIVGRSPGIDHNSFLVSDLAADDFRLTVDVKLIDNQGNSGIQFRSEPVHGYEELLGYQADVGAGWWGKLYEENGRALLWDQSGEQHVNNGEWNRYEIFAEGDRIRTWINGQLCVDLEDPEGRRHGVFALQLHSGEPTEVRFRNLSLEILGD